MMNRVMLVGRLTKDPETRYTPNGVAVCSFTLAVNRIRTNQNGDREADFINVVVWRAAAENLAKYVGKGDMVGVDGRIQTRNYEGQDGKRVYVTEVLAEHIQYLETKKNRSGSEGGSNYNSNQGSGSGENNDPFRDGQPIDISDDDLPF